MQVNLSIRRRDVDMFGDVAIPMDDPGVPAPAAPAAPASSSSISSPAPAPGESEDLVEDGRWLCILFTRALEMFQARNI